VFWFLPILMANRRRGGGNVGIPAVLRDFHGPSFPLHHVFVVVLPAFFWRSKVRRKRYDSVPVSRMCARSVIRSSSALQSLAFGIICVHSENGRFVVRTTAVLSARSAMI